MVFVAGGTGYTGRFLVKALLKAGEQVRCLVRQSNPVGLEEPGVSLVLGDLERPEGLVGALEGAEALVSASHIRYAPALISACAHAGVKRAVFLSSTWRFSKVRTEQVEAVIAGEGAVEASGLEATLLRPTMIYGPGEDRNVSRLREYLGRHRVIPIFGSGEQMVQPVHVADVADAAAAAIGRAATIRKAYEIAGPYPISYTEMIDTLCRALGRTVLKVYLPLSLSLLPVRVYGWISRSPRVTVDEVRRMGEDRAFDISEAVRDLAYSPRSFEAGVREAMR